MADRQKHSDTNWTEQDMAILREAILADKSFSVIAAIIGKSRSAIGGKIRRMRRELRNNAAAPSAARPVLRRKPIRKPPAPPAQRTPIGKRTPVAPKPIPPVAPSLHPVPFLKAGPKHCRAILDQTDRKGGVLFCGDPKQPESSYCPTHHKRFHRDSTRPEE